MIHGEGRTAKLRRLRSAASRPSFSKLASLRQQFRGDLSSAMEAQKPLDHTTLARAAAHERRNSAASISRAARMGRHRRSGPFLSSSFLLPRPTFSLLPTSFALSQASPSLCRCPLGALFMLPFLALLISDQGKFAFLKWPGRTEIGRPEITGGRETTAGRIPTQVAAGR